VFKSAFSFGIDIESPKKKAMETIESIISADESVPRDLRHYAVAWTLKESLSKALKSGFRLPFGEFKMSDFCEERDIFTCRYQKHPEFCGTAIFCNGTSVAFTYPSEMEFHIPYSDLIDLFNNILLKF
jgi:4'-phosphopantetheinyl transferase EntD